MPVLIVPVHCGIEGIMIRMKRLVSSDNPLHHVLIEREEIST